MHSGPAYLETQFIKGKDQAYVKFSLSIALLVLTCTKAIAASLSGKVVRVADGDTVTVLDASNTQHRIPLQGIDAPERKQPYGRRHGKYLAEAVAGQVVVVGWVKRDRYGRIVGKVLLDGQDMNLRQIGAGLAWHYTKYSVEQSAAICRCGNRCQRRGARLVAKALPGAAVGITLTDSF